MCYRRSSATDKDQLLSGASEYAIYFVLLAVGAGFVQFAAVSDHPFSIAP